MNVYLVYFDREAAAQLENLLLDHGMTVVVATRSLDADVQQLAQRPLDAAAVILDADPDDALERVAELKALRKFKPVPLLFAGGTVADLTEAERRFPGASFTRIAAILTSLASVKG